MVESSEAEKRRYVKNFLNEYKALVIENRGMVVQNPGKNRLALAALGLTEKQREEIVLSLSLSDYHSGPDPDLYHAGDQLFVFGKSDSGIEIYIKLKIGRQGDREIPLCISFHRAEWAITYPFK